MQNQIHLFLGRLRQLAQRKTDRNPLYGPLGRLGDGAIDAELNQANIDRRDLFCAETSVAQHRKRISMMMSNLGISVDYVVEQYWSKLKLADHSCAFCSDVRRCEQWLSLGRWTDEPKYFCPNATFFANVKIRQHSDARRPEPPADSAAEMKTSATGYLRT